MATMTQVLEKTGAGEGNRTLVISLEGCCSTIELHPHAKLTPYERSKARPRRPPSPDKGAFDKRLRRASLRPRLASRSAEGAKAGGGGRTRTYKGVSQRIYSPTRDIDIVGEAPCVSQLCCSDSSSLAFNALTPPADF